MIDVFNKLQFEIFKRPLRLVDLGETELGFIDPESGREFYVADGEAAELSGPGVFEIPDGEAAEITPESERLEYLLNGYTRTTRGNWVPAERLDEFEAAGK